jgi:hypothetical protein
VEVFQAPDEGGVQQQGLETAENPTLTRTTPEVGMVDDTIATTLIGPLYALIQACPLPMLTSGISASAIV